MSRAGSFQDHFSGHAAAYRAARPTYPAALFQQLAAISPGHALAWDAGCGNGQASLGLAAHFAAVFASDPSVQQLGGAPAHPRITYAAEPAEQCSLADGSVDLVVVAQALHWFDLDAFYAQVRRVAKPGAVIAAWTYVQSEISPAIDALVRAFYHGPINRYWPQDRQKVEAGYEGLPFPFEPVDPGPVFIEMAWTARQMSDYVATWSAVQRYQAATGDDPLPAFAEALAAAWGSEERIRPVRWPLKMLCGRIPAGNVR